MIYKLSMEKGRKVYRLLGFRFRIKSKKLYEEYLKKCKIEEDRKIEEEKKILLTPGNLVNVGKQSYCGGGLFIANLDTKVGSFCSFGQNVVLGHGEHPKDFLSTSPYFYFDELEYKNEDVVSHSEYWDLKPINIGNDVWVGDGVFIKNGINIGDGAIIGARAVVTKDVPSYAIAVGCPARVMNYRFSEEIINDLLELKWWDLEDEVIKTLPYDDIELCIKKLKEIKNK